MDESEALSVLIGLESGGFYPGEPKSRVENI